MTNKLKMENHLKMKTSHILIEKKIINFFKFSLCRSPTLRKYLASTLSIVESLRDKILFKCQFERVENLPFRPKSPLWKFN